MSEYTIKAIKVRTSAMAELNHRHNDFNKHMQNDKKKNKEQMKEIILINHNARHFRVAMAKNETKHV